MRTVPTNRIETFLVVALPGLAYFALVSMTLPISSLLIAGSDEGMELAKAMNLFREPASAPRMWNDQPILISWIWSKLFAVAGEAAGPPRWMSLVCAAVLLGSISSMSFAATGSRLASLVAATYLMLSPIFLVLSFSAMQELPGLACSYAGMAIVLGISPQNCRMRILTAGLVLGVAVQIKLTMLMYAALASGLCAIQLHQSEPKSNQNFARSLRYGLALFLIAVSVSITLSWTLGDWRPSQLFGSHLQAAAAMDSMGFFSEHGRLNNSMLVPTLLLLGLVGIGHAWHKSAGCENYFRCFLLVVLTVALFSALIRPWWWYYGLHLHAALAAFAGFLGATLERTAKVFARSLFLGDLSAVKAFTVSLVLCVLLTLKSFSAWFTEFRLWKNSELSTQVPLIRTLKSYSQPGQFMYADDPIFAFQAGVRIPPELAVISKKRLLTGQASDASLGSMIVSNECRQILVSPDHLTLLPHIPRLTNDYVLVSERREGLLWIHRCLNPNPEPKQQLAW